MIIDVHVHIRSKPMLARALRQARAAQHDSMSQQHQPGGQQFAKLPVPAVVSLCNDRNAAVAAANPERVIPMWLSQPGPQPIRR